MKTYEFHLFYYVVMIMLAFGLYLIDNNSAAMGIVTGTIFFTILDKNSIEDSLQRDY